MAEVKAPMPGKIIEICVQPGDAVSQHQELVIIESMKMENPICARDPGTVREVSVQVGETVNTHQVLLVME